MMHILTSRSNRDNDDIEGFGERWDDDSYTSWDTTNFGGLPEGSFKTVSFKPLFGILNQPKYIPLSWCPMQMEFEVVNGAEDPIVSPGTGAGANDFQSYKYHPFNGKYKMLELCVILSHLILLYKTAMLR
jgi:hypothetical protein